LGRDVNDRAPCRAAAHKLGFFIRLLAGQPTHPAARAPSAPEPPFDLYLSPEIQWAATVLRAVAAH
jgi:hypothetical protein